MSHLYDSDLITHFSEQVCSCPTCNDWKSENVAKLLPRYASRAEIFATWNNWYYKLSNQTACFKTGIVHGPSKRMKRQANQNQDFCSRDQPKCSDCSWHLMCITM